VRMAAGHAPIELERHSRWDACRNGAKAFGGIAAQMPPFRALT
jgi:hypothetical protein